MALLPKRNFSFCIPAAGNAGKSYREILSNSIKVKSSELWNITHISLFHIQTLRGRVAQVYLLTNLGIEFIFLPPVLGQSSRPYYKKFSCYCSSCFPFLTPSQGPCCTKYQCAAPPQRMSPCWQTPALLLDCSCWRPTASWRDTRTSRRCTGSCAIKLTEDVRAVRGLPAAVQWNQSPSTGRGSLENQQTSLICYLFVPKYL